MNYSSELSKKNFPRPLTDETIKKLIPLAHCGNKKAKDTIIMHNLLMIKSSIKDSYLNYFDEDDLWEAGLYGLIKAINTFDVSKGFKFSTYAFKCVDNEIKVYIRNNSKYATLVDSFDKELTNSKDDTYALEETLYDETYDFASDIIDKITIKENSKKLYNAIASLESLQQKIICMYYGLDYDFINQDNNFEITQDTMIKEPMTQKEISDLLNISRSYISRIIKSCLKQLKKKLCTEEKIEEVKAKKLQKKKM